MPPEISDGIKKYHLFNYTTFFHIFQRFSVLYFMYTLFAKKLDLTLKSNFYIFIYQTFSIFLLRLVLLCLFRVLHHLLLQQMLVCSSLQIFLLNLALHLHLLCILLFFLHFRLQFNNKTL